MVRVLLIDDSPLARRMLARALEVDGLELAGESSELEAASALIEHSRPDVVVLDIARTKGDGLSWLNRLTREHDLPFIACSRFGASSDAAARALAAGAVAVVNKPESVSEQEQLARDLGDAIRRARLLTRPFHSQGSSHVARAAPLERAVAVIAIGAATGGTAALERLLSELLPEAPPVLVVQHLPTPQITHAFAARLDRELRQRVQVARDGEPLRPGSVWIAPADRHLTLARAEGELRIELDEGEPVDGQRPAADVLFQSLATHEPRSVGVLLTGMGSDGARGLAQLHQVGAHTIVQDEASSVVWDMPKAALELGAADEILPLRKIAQRLNQLSLQGGSARMS